MADTTKGQDQKVRPCDMAGAVTCFVLDFEGAAKVLAGDSLAEAAKS